MGLLGCLLDMPGLGLAKMIHRYETLRFKAFLANTPEAIDEVGCIHSIQGYDLNYAFVILGNDIGYDEEKKRIVVYSEHYYDKNGKRTTTENKLLEYVKNVYYVLMTRGIRGTYLYVCDRHLRTYLQRYIEMET